MDVCNMLANVILNITTAIFTFVYKFATLSSQIMERSLHLTQYAINNNSSSSHGEVSRSGSLSIFMTKCFPLYSTALLLDTVIAVCVVW